MSSYKPSPRWKQICRETRKEIFIVAAVVFMLFFALVYFILIPAQDKNNAECERFAASVDMSLPANGMTYKLCREAR